MIPLRSENSRNSSPQDITSNSLREGKFIILKDDSAAKDWYCAEVRAVLIPDRIEVNYYTTQAPPRYKLRQVDKEIQKSKTGGSSIFKDVVPRSRKRQPYYGTS